MLRRLRDWLSATPRINAFAETMIHEFGKRNSHGWTYDAKANVLRQGSDAAINLANIFRQYAAAARADRPTLLVKYADVVLIQARPIPTLWEVAACVDLH